MVSLSSNSTHSRSSAAPSSTPLTTEQLEFLGWFKDEEPSWEKGMKWVQSHPEDARLVDPKTGMLPLHYAVSKRKARGFYKRLGLIKVLLKTYPQGTTRRCRAHGYTPLAYACCSVEDDERTLKHDAEIIRLLLSTNKETRLLTGKDGHTPLALHIISISKLRAYSWDGLQPNSSSSPATTEVLRVLTHHDSTTRGMLTAAVEKLYACNTFSIMQRFAQEEAHTRRNIQNFGRQTRASDFLADFWVWDWVLNILQAIHELDHEGNPSFPFHPLHVASQLVDFPTPFLMFAMRSYPSEMRVADLKSQNLPLHFVAAWKLPTGATTCRKSCGLTSLVAEYPSAITTKNKEDLTPMDLEQESGSIIE